MATRVIVNSSKRLRRELPAVMSVTEKAAERVTHLLSGNPDALGIRVGVKTRKTSLSVIYMVKYLFLFY